MGVTAFTNRVGTFSHQHTVYHLSKGIRYGVPINNRDPYVISDGFSKKHEAVQGGRGPKPYFREIVSLITDDPYIVRRQVWFNEQLVVDTVEQTPMSVDFPVLYLSPPDVWAEDLDNIRSKSITEARNKLRKGQVQVGNNLGEANQVVRMITENTKRVIGAYNSLKRGNYALALKHLELSPKMILSGHTLSKKWLELQYGWLPLISDIHDGTKLLCDYVDPGKPAKMEVKVVKNQKLERDFGFVQGQRFETRWKCVGTAKCGLVAKVTCPALVGADMFGLLNPLSIAWELTPFSFILDWFIPIGNVLDSLSATAGLEFGSGYITVTDQQNFSASLASFSPGSILDRGHFAVGNYTMRRQVLPDFPLPELYAKENPFSKPHVKNAIALIRQRI